MEPTKIIFSDSNAYFQDASILQSGIGFVNPLDIDIYVKKSFSYSQDQIIVSGGYIQPFNSNHRVDDPFVCYRIQLADGQPFIKTEGMVAFDLEKHGFFSGTAVKNIIQGMPLLSILIIALLTLILPSSIARIFRYISIIGIVVTMFFYAWKFIKIFYNILKNKGIDYNGITVHYQKDTDILVINDEYVTILKELHQMNIQIVVLSGGIFYLKQILKRPTFHDIIKSMFTTIPIDDILIQQTVQDTIKFLFATSFIGQYITLPSGPQTS